MAAGNYYGANSIGATPFISLLKIANLTDNFADNSIDALKWAVAIGGAATLQETGTHLAMTLPTSAVLGDIAAIETLNRYNLIGSSMSIRAVEVPNNLTQASATFTWRLDAAGNNWVRLVEQGGILYAERKVSGYQTAIGNVPYDPVAMLYWRIREHGGLIFFETSADSMAWTTRFTWGWSSSYVTIDAGKAVMQFYAWQNETSPGSFIFDDFNITNAIIEMPPIAFVGDSSMSSSSPFVQYVNNALPRTYQYKVFDKDGNYLRSWEDVTSDFEYGQDINTAGSVIKVKLGRSIDTPLNETVKLLTEAEPAEHILTEAGEYLEGDYRSPNRVGEGTDVSENNRVEVWEYYGSIDEIYTSDTLEVITTSDGEPLAAHFGAPNGRLCFTGVIQEFEADYGTTDDVVVTIASMGIEADNYVVKSGETTTVPFLSVDPANMFKSSIDNVAAQGSRLTYLPLSIRNTGNIASYKLQLNTLYEVAKKSIELSPEDWYWFGDVANSALYMQPRPSRISHRFILGQHILTGKWRRSILNMVNLKYFVGGDKNNDPDNPDYLYRKFADQPSIDKYGQKLDRETDQRVTDETSASLLGNADIAAGKNPRYAGTVDISSKTYPIETVRLGQLVGFGNFGNFIDNLQLVVASIKYTPDVLSITLEVLPPRIDKRLEEIKRNLRTQEQLTTPSTPS
jgi:hypothetical protein